MAYEYADCYFCKGKVVEKEIDLVRKWKGKYILIEGVPAGVCEQCGEKYFKNEVAEEMDLIMQTAAEEEAKIQKKVIIPVVRLHEAMAT